MSVRTASASVASALAAVYRAGVSFRRILSLLVLLAFVLAPAPMLAGSPAMAMDQHEAMATSDGSGAGPAHPCAGEQSPAKKAPHDCCVMGCVAVPAVGGELALHLPAPSLRQRLPASWDSHGLAPEADPPPPRLS